MSLAGRALPPGIDAQTHHDFFDELSTIVGEVNISRDGTSGALEGPHQQTSYGDPFPLDDAGNHVPSGGVRPASVAELQEVLKTANRLKIPLWTVSRGRNLGYGGTAPVVKGSVVLDLHRMNKIIEINQEYSYAIVEPGVSFFDLFNEIKQRDLALWPSCPAIGWGSIIGNTLDRGFGYTPAGMGAMKDSSLFALFKGGYGPSVDGLFYQSNLGVVTKIGIHLTPAPESYMGIAVSVPEEEDLVALVGTLSALQRQNIITNSPSISNAFRQALVSDLPSVRSKLIPYCGPNKCVPEDVLRTIGKEQGWGFWKAEFGLYGSVETVPALFKTLERAFESIKGAKIESKYAPGVAGKFLRASELAPESIPHTGIPTLEPLHMMDYRKPGSGHVSFSPLIPPSGREIYEWYLTAKKRTADASFDFFADFHVYPHHVIAIDLLVFAQEEAGRVDDLYRVLLEDAQQLGYSEYRTHVRYMDAVGQHFDFNDGALGRFVGRLKDTLDPNGILASGKSSIWGSKKVT
ncbi:Vanillyl alcohol oxidase [Pleurostoma richardsiae]|uniref:Vanillyl alcohol oxidase n=1 Tax=Pleurostoma richardsiae TaxID=41990 RepID=A0AA38RGK0_9PEZI|nr:Vanillyl alcohol oxidase [Pleurostoma richardsiae]